MKYFVYTISSLILLIGSTNVSVTVEAEEADDSSVIVEDVSEVRSTFEDDLRHFFDNFEKMNEEEIHQNIMYFQLFLDDENKIQSSFFEGIDLSHNYNTDQLKNHLIEKQEVSSNGDKDTNSKTNSNSETEIGNNQVDDESELEFLTETDSNVEESSDSAIELDNGQDELALVDDTDTEENEQDQKNRDVEEKEEIGQEDKKGDQQKDIIPKETAASDNVDEKNLNEDREEKEIDKYGSKREDDTYPIKETKETLEQNSLEHLEVSSQNVDYFKSDRTNKKSVPSYETQTVAYNANVSNPYGVVYSQPGDTGNTYRISLLVPYSNEKFTIRKEAKISDESWVLVEHQNKNIGWVLKKNITPQFEQIKNERTVAYNAIMDNTLGNYQIFSRPAYTTGNYQIANSQDYIGSSLVVRGEIETDSPTYRLWAQIELSGNNFGWINSKALIPQYEEIVSERSVAYEATVSTDGRYQIFNRPAYTEGNYKVAESQNFKGNKVIVRGEIETDYENERVWALIEVDGNEVGWINSKALNPEYEEVISERTVAYNAIMNSDNNYQIFNRPAYTKGNHQVANAEDLFKENVIVRGEIKTDSNTNRVWALIEFSGNEIGWINSKALLPDYEKITSEKNVAYEGTVRTDGRYQIFNRPAYTEGNYQILDSAELRGESIVVRKEIQTDSSSNRTWVLIELDGNEIGWINNNGIAENYDKIISSRSLNHPRIIRDLDGRYQIFSKPAYTEGNYQIANVSDYVGEVAVVTEERTTDRGIWQLLRINGSSIGWINREGLRKPIIFIDPGHGGTDPGATHGGVREKDLNLQTSLYIKDALKTAYYDIVMSRETDRFVSLDNRTDHANEIKADIFVSVHYNSMGGTGTARGIETFIHHRVPSGFGQEVNRNNFRTENPRIRESLALADLVHPEIIRTSGLRDRGVKGNNFHVLRESNMPAILLELGFLDNYSERRHVNRLSYQRSVASGIAKGIDDYFRN